MNPSLNLDKHYYKKDYDIFNLTNVRDQSIFNIPFINYL